jgi:chromosome segregation ATPase
MALFSRTPKVTIDDLEAIRAEVASLRSELTKRSNELSLVTAATNGLDQRIAALDTRIAGMSTELANQVHELGREIEQLAEREHEPETAAALEQIRISQTRIANEQARYEIAFRQDLAMLAERIRRND